LLAKSVIREFYGQCPQQSYFVRCSEGGREALMEAKRFPDDYDGIIQACGSTSFIFAVTIRLYIAAAR